jgi:hypothetical protein
MCMTKLMQFQKENPERIRTRHKYMLMFLNFYSELDEKRKKRM